MGRVVRLTQHEAKAVHTPNVTGALNGLLFPVRGTNKILFLHRAHFRHKN